MPSRDVNAVTRLAEASWWRDNFSKYTPSILQVYSKYTSSILQVYVDYAITKTYS